MCRKLFLLVCFVLVLGLVGNAWAEILSEDVGGPALPGSSVEVSSGVWSVEGDGTGIGGTSDQFHFVYQRMDGDCNLVVNLTSLDPGARAGVMIRQTLDGDSAHATMSATAAPPLNSVMFQYRPGAGGPTPTSLDTSQAVPERLRITRQGQLLKGEYYYSDYTVWVQQGGTVNIPMDDCVYIGLVVTSNTGTALALGEFEGVAWTGTPCAPPEPVRTATEPSPMDGAEDVPIDPILTWEPGEGAIYHLVSFSSNFDDVNNVAVLDAVPGTSYDPGILNLTETYYWAVHTMWQDGIVFGLAMGDIWSFTIVDHILLEDFEPYHVPPEAIPGQYITKDAYIAVEAVPPDDVNHLVAYWPLDVDYNDYSGSGFHGDPCGDATLVFDAERGNVLSLDSDGDYVNCGNPPALNFSTGNWSLSAWVKNTMTGTGDANKGAIIANGGDGGGGHRYCLIQSEQEEAEVTLVTDDDSTKAQARGDTTKVNNDAWHHVLGVRDGDTIRIYIDGVEEGSAGLPGGYDLSGTSQREVLIGAIYNHGGGYTYKDYGGLIDDVRIYDCALTEGNARFMNGLGNVEIPARYGPMIAHYTFDADDASDSSGNSRHGVENGGPGYVADDFGGRAIELDGGQDVTITGFIEIQDNDELSIAMWVKPDTTDGQRFMWFTHESSGNSKIRCRVIDGDWSWRHGNGSTNIEVRADATAGVWTHYAGVRRNGDKLYLYINGLLENQTAFSGPAGLQSNSWIGSEQGGNKFDGCIDDVRIYDIALSHGQIVDLAVDSPNPLADTWTDSGELVSSLETWGTYETHHAMRVDVNGVGEVRRLSPFEDWTLANLKACVLYVKGDPDNVIDDLYMGLTSAVGLPRTAYLSYPDDINDLNIAEWFEWNVDVDTMSTAFGGGKGVPLPHISEIAFGASGTGTLTFDYLTLWTTRCVPKYGPYADITDDCVVDYKDIRVLAGDWLEHDSAIYPVPPPAQVVVEPNYIVVAAAPDDANHLLSYYTFDNDDANDSSGNEHHCVEMPGREGEVVAYDNSKAGLGRALKLDDDGEHVLDDDAGDYMNGLSEMTISVWIKSDKTGRDEGWIIFGDPDDFNWSDRRGIRYDSKGGDSKELRNVIKYGVQSDDNEEDESYGDVQTKDWQHVAMTWKSEDLGGEVGLKLYIDGVLDIPGYNNPPEGGVTEGYYIMLIGKGSKDNSSNESWNGLIDEVRIYDCALSYGEVRYLAGELDDLEIPTVYGPMIAGYNFDIDDDASDTSGNGINGTLAGATVSGGVLHLDGDNDCVDIGHSARFNPESGPFSISVWINIERWRRNWAGIVTKRGEDSRGWQLRRSSGNDELCFTVRGTSAGDDMHGNIAPTLDEWHHVAAIWDPDAEKRTMYIDGQLDRQINDSGTVRWMGHNVYIGARARKDNRIWNGIDNEFQGMIDDVQIYDHALSYLEMLYLATGQTRIYSPIVSDADLFEDEPEESRYVNFKDYAVMADQWLLELLWP